MLVNTQYFREEARYFERHGKYNYGIKGSDEYKRWWREQTNRCLYGYSVGGMRITGYHYFYLNFAPIQIVEKVGKKSGIRKLGFPKFWDLDYAFFHSADIAKYGVPESFLKRGKAGIDEYFDGHQDSSGIVTRPGLAINIPIKRDLDNVEGGHHLAWLKGRGVGASFKTGAMAARNYHIVPRSKSFFFADQKEFLTKDGVYSKFLEYSEWININAPEFKEYHTIKGDRNNMHFINSDRDEYGNVVGLSSEALGVTVENNPNKARGKRGMLMLWEEAGNFGSLDEAWNVCRSSVEEDGIVYGLMVMFGTGGTEGADFQSMEKMFYNPRSFNIMAFDNIWDVGTQGTDSAYFTAGYQQIQTIDEHGNSNIEAGKANIKALYDQAEKSPDPTDLIRVKAEKPTTPQDAMLNTTINNFTSEGLTQWQNKLIANSYYKNFANAVELFRDPNDGLIKTKLNDKHPPILKFPHDARMDLHGSVVEYSKPWRNAAGEIPDDLYIVCLDPFADDHAADRTSLGSAYVIMNSNNIVPGDKGDRIVAEWVGRPDTTDEYNEILFMLAERWNAKIGFENDRGDTLGFAKRKKLVHLLAPEFEMAWDEKIAKKPTAGKYGMRMASGSLNYKVLQGNRYIKDWLYNVRGENSQGRIFNNYHLIYSPALLEELKKYSDNGNFDRVSALRVGMYFMQELAYQDVVPQSNRSSNNRSFKAFLNTRRSAA